jgi:hypothetical protein
MNLVAWAVKWGIPADALIDLKLQMGLDGTVALAGSRELTTETGAQSAIRLEAADNGIHLWRNNVGALQDETGRWVRYGLVNDTKALNEKVKSHDLIGIKPGGQFISREVKKPGWVYSGTKREQAQLKFAHIVLAAGGDAAFATGPGSL